MSSEDKNSPGNYGLMDQLRALEFVRDVAWYIRGDPKNVTIFGSEAGAASTAFHTLSPKARGRGRCYLTSSLIVLCDIMISDYSLYIRFSFRFS